MSLRYCRSEGDFLDELGGDVDGPERPDYNRGDDLVGFVCIEQREGRGDGKERVDGDEHSWSGENVCWIGLVPKCG